MKKVLSRSFLIALTALLLASCCQCNTYERKYGRPLIGTQWIMIQNGGRSFETKDNYWLKFDNKGRFTGIGDCNTINGTYSVPSEIKGDMSIRVDMVTRMSCPNGGEEQLFIAMLNQIDSFHREGPYLYVFSHSELTAVFRAEGSADVKLYDFSQKK